MAGLQERERTPERVVEIQSGSPHDGPFSPFRKGSVSLDVPSRDVEAEDRRWGVAETRLVGKCPLGSEQNSHLELRALTLGRSAVLSTRRVF